MITMTVIAVVVTIIIIAIIIWLTTTVLENKEMCNFCKVVNGAADNASSPMGFTPTEMVDIFDKMRDTDGIEVSPLFQKEDVVQVIKWLFTNGFIAILIGHRYNPDDHQANQYINGPAYAESMQQPSPFGVFPGAEKIDVNTIKDLINSLVPGLNLTDDDVEEMKDISFDESVEVLTQRLKGVANNGTPGFPPASLN
jgi:hypothetical protein